MNLNELLYGNPSIDVLPYVNARSFLDVLFAELSDSNHFTFPMNDSSVTRNELNDLVQKSATCQTEADILQRYQRYDRSLLEVYTDVAFDNPADNEDYRKLLLSVFEDLLPLIFKLKINYQRPRPCQLAIYYKLKLFPFYSYSADSPSYPSLHACVARVLAGVLSTKYISAASYFNELGKDVAASRLYLGVNFHSSVEMGKLIGDKVLQNADFIKKYKL